MLTGEAWFKYLSEGQRDLVRQAYSLLDVMHKSIKATEYKEQFHDYSFVVFPMAKAYEGFLKQWFLDAGLIDKATYEGDRFRIGKALNPSMPLKHRGKWWLYGRLTIVCGGKKLPDDLWLAWRECRNRLFHFFPKHKHFINFKEAKVKIEFLRAAMKALYDVKV